MRKLKVLSFLFFVVLSLSSCETTNPSTEVYDCMFDDTCSFASVNAESDTTSHGIDYINQQVNEYPFDINYSKTTITFLNVNNTENLLFVLLYEPENSTNVFHGESFYELFDDIRAFFNSNDYPYHKLTIELRKINSDQYAQIVFEKESTFLEFEVSLIEGFSLYNRTSEFNYETNQIINSFANYDEAEMHLTYSDAVVHYDWEKSSPTSLLIDIDSEDLVRNNVYASVVLSIGPTYTVSLKEE